MIAFYIRLSKTDEDVGKKKPESNSVENQRKILYDFINELPELRKAEIVEFVDDGYSGLTFDRPAFQKMIADVRRQKIDTIIVKDLSRFGRDYIEAGNYLERFFPFMGVRFLSVNDSYDYRPTTQFADRQLEVAMKNIINSYYSKDLSHKIHAAFQSRTDQGEYIMANRAFGYVPDPVNPGHSVIDEPASHIIRLIFELALQGHSPTEITKILNEKEIPTRAAFHKQNKRKGKTCGTVKSKYAAWTNEKVRAILINEEYAGIYIGRKLCRTAVGVNRYRTINPCETSRIPDHHPPIITPAAFAQAQTTTKRRIHHQNTKRRYPLKGKVLCGNCGYTMIYSERKIMDCFFQCVYRYKTQQNIGCCEERFDEERLNTLVLHKMKLWFSHIKQIGSRAAAQEQRRVQKIQQLTQTIQQLQKTIADFRETKIMLYESYCEGKLDRCTFIQKRTAITNQQTPTESQLNHNIQEMAVLKKSKIKKMPEFEDLLHQISLYENEPTLTRTMTELFLEKLLVHDTSHFKIIWKWQELTDEITKSLADNETTPTLNS